MEQTAAQKIRADAKEATRRALLRAGLEETIANKGALPSIERVCARAGYTRGAFYVHFKSRDAFTLEVMDWVARDIFRDLFAGPGSDDADLFTIVRRFVEALASGRWPDGNEMRSAYLGVVEAFEISPRIRERHAEVMRAAMARVEDALRAGQTGGRIRPSLDPERVAELMVVLSIGAIMWDGVGTDFDPAALGDTLLRLLEPDAPA